MEPAVKVSPDAPKIRPRRRDLRPKIIPQGNGRSVARTRDGRIRLRTLEQLDRRTAAYQVARNLIVSLETDLVGELSVAQRQLVTRAALLGAVLEDFETRWLAGEEIALRDYLFAVSTQRRLLSSLGALEPHMRETSGFFEALERVKQIPLQKEPPP